MNRCSFAAVVTIFACDQVNAPPVDSPCPGDAACHAQGGAPREPTSGAGAGGDGAPSGGATAGSNGAFSGGATATAGSGAVDPDCPDGVCSGASGGEESAGAGSGGSPSGGSSDGGASAGASPTATGGAVSAGAGGAGGDAGGTNCSPGDAEVALVCFPPSSDTSYPFMMSGLRFKYPNTSVSTRSLTVAAINNHGVAVGTRTTCRGDPQPFEVNPRIWLAFSYADGVITLLSDEGSTAHAINDKGTIVGSIGGQAVMWRNGEAIRLSSSEVIALNEQDQVLLRDGRAALLWADGVKTPIGDDIDVYDLNDLGEVVGVGRQTSRAFVWKDRVFHDLPPLDGESESRAEAINDQGQVLGTSGSHVVIWENRIPRRLSPEPEVPISLPLDINNAGSVVGTSLSGMFLYSSGAFTRVGSVLDYYLRINDNGVMVGTNYIWSPSCYDICCNAAARE